MLKLRLFQVGLGGEQNTFYKSVETFPLPSGPSVLADICSFLQSMWDPHQIHPLLLAHWLVCTPFGEQREGWHMI